MTTLYRTMILKRGGYRRPTEGDLVMRRHRFLSSLLVLALAAVVVLGASSPAAADSQHTFGKKIDGTYFLAEFFQEFPAGSRIVTLTSEGRWLSVASTEPAFGFSNQQGDWKKTGAREITATILNFNHDAGGSESGVTKAVVVMTFSADYQMVSGSFTAVTFAAGDNPLDPQSQPSAPFTIDFVGQRLDLDDD